MMLVVNVEPAVLAESMPGLHSKNNSLVLLFRCWEKNLLILTQMLCLTCER